MKPEYIALLLIGVGIFNSCTGMFIERGEPAVAVSDENERIATPSGAYLVARVAHMRQDLGTAADFYAKAVDLGFEQADIIGRAYLLLAIEGKVDRAYAYAQKARENGDKNYMLRFVDVAYETAHQDYASAETELSEVNDKFYVRKVVPPFRAWVFAGRGDRAKALKALDVLKNERQLKSLYYMHTGLINDFFDQDDEAQKAYDTVVNDEKLELSFRSLQIISNFYLRHDRKDRALELIKKYCDKNNRPLMLMSLYRQVESVTDIPEKLIDSAEKGMSEAFFNTGTAFRNYQNDVAQIFTALALYLNPNHDVAHVSVADLAENARQFDKARAEYGKISEQSPIYFMARFKMATIYLEEKKYEQAREALRNLDERFPNNYQILFNLGEVSRVTGHQTEAIRYYRQAVEAVPEDVQTDWMLLYALGVAYERNDEWQRAEEVFQKALVLSNRHPLVLNYLGYGWLKHNKNPNEALYMIFEAYRQNPEDPYIIDSLGWALFRMGKYEDSVKVLERAADYLPDNAVICEHLGDAYWQNGRKTEARHQWQHALTLEDDSDEIDADIIRHKLKNGMPAVPVLPFNEDLLVERLKSLNP